jgi:hypothetical protein
VNDGYVTRAGSKLADSEAGCSCDATDRAAGYRVDVQVGDNSSNENFGSVGAIVVIGVSAQEEDTKDTVGLRSDDPCLIWGIG